MNTVTTWETRSTSLSDTLSLGARLGRRLKGGEVIELTGDLGTGKTAFVRGLVRGMGSNDEVASPSFTIARVYRGRGLELHHYDFYRLDQPGVVAEELKESLADPRAAVAIEWSQTVVDALPPERLTVAVTATGEQSRRFAFSARGSHARLLRGMA